jgi:hypothetical protein
MPEPLSEAAIVQAIIDELAALGYETLVVGQRKAKGSGTTTGYPDLSVRRQGWPQGLALLLEAKTADGTLRPEQADLHERGWSFVPRSAYDALLALWRTECAMGEDGAAQKVQRRLRGMQIEQRVRGLGEGS